MSEENQNLDDVDRALHAWTAMDPPADFVDRVLSARVPSAHAPKRAWWLAAPIAAVAMIALVLVFSTRSKRDAAESRGNSVAMENSNVAAAPRDVVAAGSGSAVMSGSGAVAMNQPDADAGVAAPNGLVDTASSDISIVAGSSAVIHDTAPTTRVQIDFGSLCATGALVTAFRERDGNRSGTTGTASGLTHAVFEADRGLWTYEVWCNSDPDTLAAGGTVRILDDNGRRPIPAKWSAQSDLQPDGRLRRVTYRWRAPEIHVHVTKDTTTVTLMKDGVVVKELPIEFGVAVIGSGEIEDGMYVVTPVPVTKTARPTSLILDYDEMAPILTVGTIKESADGMKITGRVLFDWSVDVNGAPVTYLNKKTGAFEGAVGFGAVVLHAKHRTHDHHFFVLPVITR